ncbi:MAG: hypothetical protein ACTSRR_02935 [Candidatus Heimdallarchaeaceae archaeon]
MNRFFLIIYPWDSIDRKNEKKKNLIGTFLMMSFSGIYSLILLGIFLKKILPIISKSENELLGKNSITVRFLNSIFSNGWLFAIIFVIIVVLYSITYFFNLKIDQNTIKFLFTRIKATKDYYNSLFRVFLIVCKELIEVIFIALLEFIIAEIITLGLVSIISTISISLALNSSLSIYGLALATGIFIHVLSYPIMNALYFLIIIKEKKEKKVFRHFDHKKIDFELEKWREHTWGKKGYSYDWREEEYAPFICPNCNSVISSNLVICPICGENVVELLEKLMEDEGNEKQAENDQIRTESNEDERKINEEKPENNEKKTEID